MTILGIDPGSSRMGYGIIDSRGPKLLGYGVCESKQKDLSQKLINITSYLERLIKEWRPAKAVIEKIYFSKNQKTAIEVAQARGVILLTLAQNNVPIIELGPREVKLSVAGYGLADKRAVAKMVGQILRVKDLKGYDDASDALAIAIAGSNSLRII